MLYLFIALVGFAVGGPWGAVIAVVLAYALYILVFGVLQ